MFPDVHKLGTKPTNLRSFRQCLTIRGRGEEGAEGGGGKLEEGAILKQQRIFLARTFQGYNRKFSID